MRPALLAFVAVMLASGRLSRSAAAEPLPEPPAAADPTLDYIAAPEDSIDSGSVSVDYGLSGRAGGRAGSSRSLRFAGDSVEAGLRDGDSADDAGGEMSSRTNGRQLRIGRISPAWGRGLVVARRPIPGR